MSNFLTLSYKKVGKTLIEASCVLCDPGGIYSGFVNKTMNRLFVYHITVAVHTYMYKYVEKRFLTGEKDNKLR